MEEIEAHIKKVMDSSAKYSGRIREKLQAALGGDLPERLDAIPTDMGDLHEICSLYLQAVEVLVSADVEKDKEILINTLSEIRRDIYIHLPYHYKNLKKPLIMLIDKLEGDDV